MIDTRLIRVIALAIAVAATGGLARAAEGGPPPYQADLQRQRRPDLAQRDAGSDRCRGAARRAAGPAGGELQSRLSRISADLPQLHSGRRSRDSTLSRRG